MEKNEVLQKSDNLTKISIKYILNKNFSCVQCIEKWLNTRIHKIRRIIGFPHNILQIIDFPTKPFEITTCAKTPMK